MQLLCICVFLSLTLALTEAKPWYEGDTCHTDQDGREWKCRSVKACSQTPGPDPPGPSCHSHALVCCPPPRPARAAGDRISKLKCEEYAKFVYLEVSSQVDGEPPEKIDLCQFSEPLLVGGQNAEPKEYPHMALVGYGSAEKKQWLCAGSLISERFVLSAAHCTSPDIVGDAKWIRLGEYDISTDQDDKNGVSDPRNFEIVERVNHPDYDPRDKYNDIALYKLDRNVEMGESIRAVCLHSATLIPKPRVLATGWGNIKPGRTDSRSTILQKGYLGIVSDQECKEAYQSVAATKTKTGFVRLKDGIRKESMFCAGGKEGVDTCLADSGGPVQFRLAEPYCMYSLVGVTSFGKTCGSTTPGVYTRVSHFLPWIESIVWP